MSKTVKDMVTSEIRARYEGVVGACVVDMTGLDVKQQEHLRRTLGEKAASVGMVKNSLARRAFAGGPLEPLGVALAGPCALVTSQDSLIDAAKTLVELAKEFDALTLKEALLDGDPDLMTVELLAKMKSRTELLGDIAGLLTSPARTLAGCLRGPQARIAGCLKTLAERAA